MSEKAHVARSSAIAGGILAMFKLAIGILSGSLALISEGIHSTIDFLVTCTTWYAVKHSDVGADREHHYGHGKIENLSAFGQAILLFVTALWILAEAWQHFSQPMPAETTRWYYPIGVVVVSLAVDASRAAALSKAARKFRSQALEADAVHFATELVSTFLVLVSLVLVYVGGEKFRIADPIGAVCVGLVMIFTAIRLGRRSADVLMDRAPEGLEHQIESMIRTVPGVHDVSRVRARQSGANRFVDATIMVDPAIGLSAAHRISDNVELRVTENFPNLDIIVHVEPAGTGEDHAAAIRQLAEALKMNLHAIRIREIDNFLYVNFHAEFPPQMTLADAHQQVNILEERIRRRFPNVAEIGSHMEPLDT